MLTISQLSKRFYKMTSGKEKIWHDFGKTYFNIIPVPAIRSKLEFFRQLKKYPSLLLLDNRRRLENHRRILIIIDRNIYDLTDFIDDHPGGPSILSEWNGRDASRTFHLAAHSTYAQKLAKKFLIWPPPGAVLVVNKLQNES